MNAIQNVQNTGLLSGIVQEKSSVAEGNKVDFGALLKNIIDQVNHDQQYSSGMTERYQLGRGARFGASNACFTKSKYFF